VDDRGIRLAITALVASVAATFPPAAAAQQVFAGDFADWTDVSGSPAVATGTLRSDVSVRLEGSQIDPHPSSRVDGSSTVFDRAEFSPPLATSDSIHFRGATGNSYTLQFGSPVTDPVLHFASLASTLHFPPGTAIERVSGDAEFSVSDSDVVGQAQDVPAGDDANGTIRLKGRFTSISYSTTYMGTDGIYLQVGADTTPPDTYITDGPADGASVDEAPTFSFTSSESDAFTECNTSSSAGSTGFRPCNSPYRVDFNLLPRAGGPVTFEVRSTDAAGNTDPTPAQRQVTYVPPRVDLSIDGIEVTQGVQVTDPCTTRQCRVGVMTPDYIARISGQNPPATYEGVTLSSARSTVVRVYVQSKGEPRWAQGAVVSLVGYTANGGTLAPGTLYPQAGPPIPPPCCPSISFGDRANPTAAYTFTLPPHWSERRTLRLFAQVDPQAGRNLVDPRTFDNSLEVRGIPFKTPTTIRIRPVAMRIRGISPDNPDNSFSGARATFPNTFEIPPYQGVVDATDAAQEPKVKKKISMAIDLVDDWADDKDYGSGVFPFGLSPTGQGLDAGATMGNSEFLFWSTDNRLYKDRPAAWAQSSGRPLTAVAHETGHGLGLLHAGRKCGSNSGGQNGASWFPDDEGRTGGFGLDRRGWTPYRILADLAPNNYASSANPVDGTAYWDLMSYCPSPPESANSNGGNENIHWLSPRNWDYLLNYFAPPQTLPARAQHRSAGVSKAQSQKLLRLMAFVDEPGQVSIESLRPTTGAPTDSLPDSPVRVVVRGEAGQVLSDTGVAVQTVHSGDVNAQIVRAFVPASGAAKVELVSDGTVVAERARSAHAPRVEIVSPRAGARLRGSQTTIRWRANDADRDALSFSLRYSQNGGRNWKTISIGRNRNQMTVPTRLLSASPNARVRVEVNDGFAEATATSGRLRSDGAPPSVSILSSSTTTRVRADGTLLAGGAAYDDTGKQLGGRRLTWFLGSRVLGHGRQLSSVDLPAGRRRLRLTARDSRGRVGTASVQVRIFAVAPRFVELKVPSSIPRDARRLNVRVATTVSATLNVGRQNFRVGRRARRVAIRVKPGGKQLRLRAVLKAGGPSTSVTLVVARPR
jgi:hypothetical protein